MGQGMHILGYIASILIGVSLGLIGGGGSILTVPVLVYLFGVSPILATSYSLFIVGSTSLVGAITNYRKGYVSLKTALLFGISSILTVFLTRKLLIPAIPKQIATIGNYTITKDVATMVLFALLMLVASFSMIRSDQGEELLAGKVTTQHFYKLLVYGIGIGLVTGLLGAGGGFLLIPALVLFVHLPMKKAVGTSLLIIALNSLIGFTGDLGHLAIDWRFMVTISLIAIAGIFIGSYLNKRIAGESLKKGFGWFVLLMGVYILVKELFFTPGAG
jgi:uncharacterized protein